MQWNLCLGNLWTSLFLLKLQQQQKPSFETEAAHMTRWSYFPPLVILKMKLPLAVKEHRQSLLGMLDLCQPCNHTEHFLSVSSQFLSQLLILLFMLYWFRACRTLPHFLKSEGESAFPADFLLISCTRVCTLSAVSCFWFWLLTINMGGGDLLPLSSRAFTLFSPSAVWDLCPDFWSGFLWKSWCMWLFVACHCPFWTKKKLGSPKGATSLGASSSWQYFRRRKAAMWLYYRSENHYLLSAESWNNCCIHAWIRSSVFDFWVFAK